MDEFEHFLEHFGVKGMHWGVHKTSKSEPIESTTIPLKNGQSLTVERNRTPAIAKIMSRMSPAIKARVAAGAAYTLKDPAGKTVGSMQLFKESLTSLNVLWIEVKGHARGRGYAQAAMKTAVDFAKREKLKTVTLEVPGNSPDARHIYEKMGFKDKGPADDDGHDPMWGGLTKMELKLTHGDVPSGEIASVLEHFGIKGMHWGVRRNRQQIDSSDDHANAAAVKQKVKKGGTKTLSNKELQDLVTRMNLEQQFDRLHSAEPTRLSKGKKAVKGILGLAKTAQEIHSLVNSPLGKEIRKSILK